MMRDDYTPFIDEPPSILYTRDDETVLIVVPDLPNIREGLFLWHASDAEAFELVMDAKWWNPKNAQTVACPDCGGDGCFDCRTRGWIATNYVEALLVAHFNGELTQWQVPYTRGDDGQVTVGEAVELGEASGPMFEFITTVAYGPRSKDRMAMAPLATVWENLGYGVVA